MSFDRKTAPAPGAPRNEMWRLAMFVTVFMGWQAFRDGPLAFYVLNGLLVTALCIEQARKSNDWPAYLYGAAMGLTTSIGGLMYAAKMDGFRFLLDAGTGLPLSMVSGLGAIGVVTYLLARKIK